MIIKKKEKEKKEKMAHQLVITKDTKRTLKVVNNTTSDEASYDIEDFSTVQLVDGLNNPALTDEVNELVEMLYTDGRLRFTYATGDFFDPTTGVYNDTTGAIAYTLAPQVVSVGGVATTSASQLRTLLLNLLEIGFENVPRIVKNGTIAALNTESDRPTRLNPLSVWPSGVKYTGFLAAASTLNIVSTNSGQDIAAGTGAREITLTGLLDASGDPAADVAVATDATNGTVAKSAGVTTYLRCHGAYVSSAGSEGANVGTITVYGAATPANNVVIIPARANKSTQATYTVSNGKEFVLESIRAQIGLEATTQGSVASRHVTLALKSGNGVIMKEELTFTCVVPGGPTIIDVPGLVFPSGTDIVIDVIHSSDTRNDNMFVNASFVGYERDN